MSSVTTLPFAGGELSSFDPQDSGCIETTNSGVGTPYDPTFSRCAIRVSGFSSAGFKSPTWAAASTFTFHGVCYWGQGTGNTIIRWYDGATVVLEGRSNTGDNTINFYTLQSSVLTYVGTLTLFAAGTAALNTLDLKLVAGGSGSLTGYLQGTSIFNVTGLNHSDFSGVTQIAHLGGSNERATYWSQIICDTVSHVGDGLVTIAEDTVSAVNTGWTGPVSDINEIVLDDTHSVVAASANLISTYYKTGASLGTWNVVGVFIGVRAQLTSGSPTNIQVCLRTNGTNYFSPTIALDFGFQACCAGWTNNPFTAAPWDTATAAAIEAGMKSIA